MHYSIILSSLCAPETRKIFFFLGGIVLLSGITRNWLGFVVVVTVRGLRFTLLPVVFVYD